jgi:hypothetical protein
VLTGSVSRGMADEVSDIEMLVVTREPLELQDCFGLARAAGLEELGTWGVQAGPARRVSGHRERLPVELIWWPATTPRSRSMRSSRGRALTESDPRRALRLMTELQLDAVLLAPSGPNVDRARIWLADGVNILRSGAPRDSSGRTARGP